MKYYVYGLIDPRDNKIKYVGKGTGSRMYDHVRKAKQDKPDSNNFTKLAGIKTILKSGYDDLNYTILFETNNEIEAYDRESKYIDLYKTLKKYGGWNLVKDRKPLSKKSRWKKGHTPWNKGLINIYSEETLQRISEGTKKGLTDESILKWKISNKDKIPWNKGLTNIYSEETKQKMRNAKLNKTLSEEHKFKISEGLKNSKRYKKVVKDD